MTDADELLLDARRLAVGPYSADVRSSPARGGLDVVMVHGIGVSGDYFLPFARVIGRRYGVHLIDLPGYGSTPRPPRPLTVPELAGVASEVASRLGLSSPVLVGQSMGCQVVAGMIAHRTAPCGGYVLIGPTVDPAARSLGRQAARLLLDMLRETPANNAVVLRDYARMGPARYLATSRSMLADHIERTIRGCHVPGLVVRGSRDPIAPAGWVRSLSSLAPDASWAEVEGAAHNAQHTHPEELAEACAPLLARVAPN